MDIVEWLRELQMLAGNADWNATIVNNRLNEAADEIEKLREERNRLREALRKIGEGDVCVSLTSMPPQCARAYQARAALKEKE